MLLTLFFCHFHGKATLADDCIPAAQPDPIAVSAGELHDQDEDMVSNYDFSCSATLQLGAVVNWRTHSPIG